MNVRLIEARHVRDFVLLVRFQDGVEGEVDLGPQLYGEVFEPLKELQFFCQFRVDSDLHTLVWPNAAYFAPEFLYELRASLPSSGFQTAPFQVLSRPPAIYDGLP